MSSVSDEELADIRCRLCVTVAGEGRVPIVPALRFTDLKLPDAVSSYLSAEKLTVPTSIQSQALPAMLLGRGVYTQLFTERIA